MRRLMPLLLLPLFAGCGEVPGRGGFARLETRPAADSEMMRRVMGLEEETFTLRPEAGNIWPTEDPAAPRRSVFDTEADPTAPRPPPPVRRGSSTPPAPVATPADPPPRSSLDAARPPTTQPPAPRGTSVMTPRGPAVVTGGATGYRTVTMPDGTPGIIMQGSGVVTLPDGTTVPAR